MSIFGTGEINMCIICLEYNKGKMTSQEALANIGETIDANQNDEDKVQHLFELANKIMDKEQPFEEWDDDTQTGVLGELDLAFMPDED